MLNLLSAHFLNLIFMDFKESGGPVKHWRQSFMGFSTGRKFLASEKGGPTHQTMSQNYWQSKMSFSTDEIFDP